MNKELVRKRLSLVLKSFFNSDGFHKNFDRWPNSIEDLPDEVYSKTMDKMEELLQEEISRILNSLK